MSSARCRSAATAAQLSRETTWARTLARSPSGLSGKRPYRWWAITSPSTLSPRNSSRSYDLARRLTHDVWVNASRRSSPGSPSISARSGSGASGRSAVAGDVVDRLTDGRDLLGILVGDLETELVLELHDQLDQVEGVGVQITLERRVLGDLLLVHAELDRKSVV